MLKLLAEYDCFVGVVDGELRICSQTSDGLPEMRAGCFLWQSPEPLLSEEFLSRANRELGTDFKLSDFKK